MECCAKCTECLAKSAESVGGAEQVRYTSLSLSSCWFKGMILMSDLLSSSPLNGQAAEFWDNDPEEFKRQVLLRHRDLEDDEE